MLIIRARVSNILWLGRTKLFPSLLCTDPRDKTLIGNKNIDWFKTSIIIETWMSPITSNYQMYFSYHTAFAKHHLIYDVPDQNGCRNGAELADPADGSTQLPWGSVLTILIEITITYEKLYNPISVRSYWVKAIISQAAYCAYEVHTVHRFLCFLQ